MAKRAPYLQESRRRAGESLAFLQPAPGKCPPGSSHLLMQREAYGSAGYHDKPWAERPYARFGLTEARPLVFTAIIDLPLSKQEGDTPSKPARSSKTKRGFTFLQVGLGRFELPTSRLSDTSRALVGASQRWKQGDFTDFALVRASQRWWAL